MPGASRHDRLRSSIRSLLRRAGLEKHAYMANLRRRTGRRPVLVYSMPKIGSTAMLEAVLDSGRGAIPLHWLGPEGSRRAARLDARSGIEGGDRTMWRTEYVQRRLAGAHRDPGTPWDILTGVRDPIGRLVSNMFHGGERRDRLDPTVAADEVDLDDLRDQCIELYRAASGWDWFRDELLPVTGIDVYREPFPTADGHARYESPGFRALLVRHEDLGRVGAAAMRAFLGDPTIDLPSSNVGESKNYADLYRRFKAEVRFPDDVLDEAYSSPMARHFYSADELEGFRRRWRGRAT